MHAYARYTFAVFFVLSSIFIGVKHVNAKTPDPNTTYVSELTGHTLDLGDSGGWKIVDTSILPESDGNYALETIQVHSTTGSLNIQFIDSTIVPGTLKILSDIVTSDSHIDELMPGARLVDVTQNNTTLSVVYALAPSLGHNSTVIDHHVLDEDNNLITISTYSLSVDAETVYQNAI